MANSDLKDRQEEIEELVLKVQEGDQDAFSQLYDIFIDPIYRYVYYRVNDEDADDLVGTVFLKVWENINKYKRGKNSFSAWIFRISHNLVVDHYRMTKDKWVAELDDNITDHKREHSPIRTTQNSLDQTVLKVALSKLKKPYQDIIVYKFVNELSNPEISGILNKSEGSLRILQFRALKALKIELINVGVDYEF